MIVAIYSTLILYFFFGAWTINRRLKGKTAAEKSSGWLKYWTYLIMVVSVSAGLFLFPAFFLLFSILIVAFGYFEIILIFYKVPETRNSDSLLMGALTIFTILATGLIFFSIQVKGILVLTFFTVTTFDGFSQLSGHLFGKRSIAPGISPNKTVEGLIGGIVMGTLTAFFLRSLLNLSASEAVLLGILITSAAFSGDILASYYKRRCGVKDYSRLIPGHGGILDRFDSLVASGAVIGLLYLLKIGIT